MDLRRIAVGSLLVAASCFASDVDGNWTGTMSTPGGDFPVNFTFKTDGAKLTGTTTGQYGDIKIDNGKLDGSNISFSTTIDFGGMPLTINYKDVVAKDEIKFAIEVLGMPMDATVKRAAPAAASLSTGLPDGFAPA